MSPPTVLYWPSCCMPGVQVVCVATRFLLVPTMPVRKYKAKNPGRRWEEGNCTVALALNS